MDVLNIEPDGEKSSRYVEFQPKGCILALFSFKAQEKILKVSSQPLTR